MAILTFTHNLPLCGVSDRHAVFIGDMEVTMSDLISVWAMSQFGGAELGDVRRSKGL